jgi:hypothetical protein
MFKSYTLAVLAGYVAALPTGTNGYSRGVPPTTQNCNSYPMIGQSTNMGAQSMPWGLEVDREFGGCRCADEDEMEFQPHADSPADNTWACRCLNEDLYPSMPEWRITCKFNPAATGVRAFALDATGTASPIFTGPLNGIPSGITRFMAAGWVDGAEILPFTLPTSASWVEAGEFCGQG